MRTVVIAKYKENIDWINRIQGWNIVILNKDGGMENVGRETQSYLWYIVSCYDHLEGMYTFCQGRPFDHCGDLIEKLGTPVLGQIYNCNDDGFPQHQLPIKWFASELGIDIPPMMRFIVGAQFSVMAEQIKKYPKEFWTKCLEYSTKDHAPWVFERLWGYIFRFPEIVL